MEGKRDSEVNSAFVGASATPPATGSGLLTRTRRSRTKGIHAGL